MPDTRTSDWFEAEYRPSILVGRHQEGLHNHINEQRWVRDGSRGRRASALFRILTRTQGVIDYIRVQVRHHARQDLSGRYLSFLKKYEVPHDERYIFRPVD